MNTTPDSDIVLTQQVIRGNLCVSFTAHRTSPDRVLLSVATCASPRDGIRVLTTSEATHIRIGLSSAIRLSCQGCEAHSWQVKAMVVGRDGVVVPPEEIQELHRMNRE